MDACDALREMLARSGVSMYALSKALGKSPGYIAAVLRHGGDIGAGNLARMAEVMGFRLVLDGSGGPIEICEEVEEDADSDQGPADK